MPFSTTTQRNDVLSTAPLSEVRQEFMSGGDPRFRALLAEILRLHITKGSDYGVGDDTFANCRGSEAQGIPAWRGVLIRMGDKMTRLNNAAAGSTLVNEGVMDSFLDLSNYALIAAILYTEEMEKKEAAESELAPDAWLRQGTRGSKQIASSRGFSSADDGVFPAYRICENCNPHGGPCNHEH